MTVKRQILPPLTCPLNMIVTYKCNITALQTKHPFYFLALAASAAFFSSDSFCFCLIISACLQKAQISQSPCTVDIRLFLLCALAFAFICFGCLFQCLCPVSFSLVATYHEQGTFIKCVTCHICLVMGGGEGGLFAVSRVLTIRNLKMSREIFMPPMKIAFAK